MPFGCFQCTNRVLPCAIPERRGYPCVRCKNSGAGGTCSFITTAADGEYIREVLQDETKANMRGMYQSNFLNWLIILLSDMIRAIQRMRRSHDNISAFSSVIADNINEFNKARDQVWNTMLTLAEHPSSAALLTGLPLDTYNSVFRPLLENHENPGVQQLHRNIMEAYQLLPHEYTGYGPNSRSESQPFVKAPNASSSAHVMGGPTGPHRGKKRKLTSDDRDNQSNDEADEKNSSKKHKKKGNTVDQAETNSDVSMEIAGPSSGEGKADNNLPEAESGKCSYLEISLYRLNQLHWIKGKHPWRRQARK